MITHVEEKIVGKVMEIHLSGKLTKEDYRRFVPETEALLQQHDKINLLVIMEDFHGWDAGALWEDFKWDMKHFNQVERFAVVGEKKWQKWMTTVCRPFTTAQIRFFAPEEIPTARAWLGGYGQ